MEVLGAFFILAAAIFAVLARGSISGGLVGLSITYALQVHFLIPSCALNLDAHADVVT